MATTISLTNYNALVEDDGSGLVGSVFDKVDILDVILTPTQTAVTALDAVDALKAPLASPTFTGVPAAPTASVGTNTTQVATTAFVLANSAVDVGVCEGRLTLTTALPVTTADVTAATNVFWTPYGGKYIALYDGSTAWTLLAFAQTTLALGTLTSGKPYDVFAYNNAGTLALEALVWTNDTTRATALVLQDGVLVKTGATTRRYLGTFYTTSTTTTEDSAVKRFLWNYYNRVRRPIRIKDTTDSWTYTLLTWRQANASAANQADVMVGVAECPISLRLQAMSQNTSASVSALVSIGEDSTTTPSTNAFGNQVLSSSASSITPSVAMLDHYPAAGRHFYVWLEESSPTGTTTWFGDNGLAGVQNGLSGFIEG